MRAINRYDLLGIRSHGSYLICIGVFKLGKLIEFKKKYRMFNGSVCIFFSLDDLK